MEDTSFIINEDSILQHVLITRITTWINYTVKIKNFSNVRWLADVPFLSNQRFLQFFSFSIPLRRHLALSREVVCNREGEAWYNSGRRNVFAEESSLSPWCIKHDERVLVTFKLALEGLVGEVQDILLVGEGADQQQRQDNQALSQHLHGSGLCDHWQVGSVIVCLYPAVYPFVSCRRRGSSTKCRVQRYATRPARCCRAPIGWRAARAPIGWPAAQRVNRMARRLHTDWSVRRCARGYTRRPEKIYRLREISLLTPREEEKKIDDPYIFANRSLIPILKEES